MYITIELFVSEDRINSQKSLCANIRVNDEPKQISAPNQQSIMLKDYSEMLEVIAENEDLLDLIKHELEKEK